jgi:DNA-binding winged helix-turn-helix (wHTH) protein
MPHGAICVDTLQPRPDPGVLTGAIDSGLLVRSDRIGIVQHSFGDFVLDLERRELRQGERPVPLSPKGFDLLQMIVGAAPRAVRREEIYEHIWGDIFVDETNISNLVSELRSALGDDSRQPRFIRTLHRVGYRFEAAVSSAVSAGAPSPSAQRSWLVFVSREFPLIEGANVIGRDPANAVCLDAASVSRRHAKLTIGAKATLEDLGSKNGTFVRGQRITAEVELADGETFSLGSVRLTFRRIDDLPPTLTEVEMPSTHT